MSHSRVFADITHKAHGEIAELVSNTSSPKSTRLNVTSRKISREIRLAVLAHDVIALRAALKAAEESNMDSHLIKAARASLTDMERNLNDENSAPGYGGNARGNNQADARAFEDKFTKANVSENNANAAFKHMPENTSKSSFESNSDSDGFFCTNDFENLSPPEGEKETISNDLIAYSVNHPHRQLLENITPKPHLNRLIEGKPYEEGLPVEIDRYRTSLQPALSERIARIKLESAKIDVCCKDLSMFLKLQHSAQEKSTEAIVELADDIAHMGAPKSEMSLEAPWMIIQGQILGRSNKNKESLVDIRKELIVHVATSIPAKEIEIRSLFEEMAFLEMECSKAMTELERTHKPVSKAPACSKDDSDCIEPVAIRETRRLSGVGITIREPRRLSGIGVAMLRRPSVANKNEGEYSSQYEIACAKIESEVTLKRTLLEYNRRAPEILEKIVLLNSQRVQLIKDALANMAVARRRQLEEELSEQNSLLGIIELINPEKDLQNLRTLSEMKDLFSENRSEPGSLTSRKSSDEQFSDPSRQRSYAVDLWSGNGIDIALEHALSSKQTVCSLHQLISSLAQILQQRSDQLSKSVKLVQAQINTEQVRIGDLQLHAFQTLINATRVQAASYDTCASSLRQASAELRIQKQSLKSIHRAISEGRARSLKELNASMAHEFKCKDLRDRLELELSHSRKLVWENASSYKVCPSQGQLDALLAKVEREERAFRQAELAYLNAQRSIQAMRDVQAIMQCQFLSKLQSAEESRLDTCAKAFRTLGYGVRDLVNLIEQSDLDVMSAFAAIDINKDLQQFIKSTYPSESDISRSAVDYVKDLSTDGFGPAYDYALSGLAQMKHMLSLLEQWADSSEYVKFLSKIKFQAPSTELTSIQSAMLQCQNLVFGFCQSVDDHTASHREIISSVDKQRHMLKAEARKIRKRFASVHRRVTLATQNHSQAAETQRRLTEKLQVVRQQNASASHNIGNSSKFSLSKFFSRDLSKTLHKTEEGVTTSKTTSDKLLQELTAAVRERESVVQSSLHSLQELENNRIAALNWCIPTLINHRQEIALQIANLAQALITSCDEVDIKAELQLFIRSRSSGTPPPPVLFEHVIESGLAIVGERSRSRSQSRGRMNSYNSEEEEGISRSNFSIGEESPTDGKLFGGDLSHAPVQNGVSKIVGTCIAFLTSRHSQLSTNTFRESVPIEDVNALIAEFRRDPDLVLVTQTVACVATVLRIYISELQPSLLPSTMVSELLSIYKNACTSQRCIKVAAWLDKMPAIHRNTLKLILVFLAEVSKCPTSQATNMAVTNLAIIWSPILLRSAVGTTIQALSRLIHDTPQIFGEPNESNSLLQ